MKKLFWIIVAFYFSGYLIGGLMTLVPFPWNMIPASVFGGIAGLLASIIGEKYDK